MEIRLGYGGGHVALQIPDGNVAGVVRPGGSGPVMSSESVVGAICGSEAWGQFVDSVRRRRVGLMLPDATRDLPLEMLLPPVLAELKAAGCELLAMVCTGTHDGGSSANVEHARRIGGMVERSGCRGRVTVHDCRRSAWEELGRTGHGTPIVYNAALRAVDAFLVLSDVKPHYFAGYSNPVKNFVPGMCHFDTAERNHSLALDDRSTFGRHPWHPDAARRENPLAADQVEATEAILGGRPAWAVVTICTHDGVQWADFDTMRVACEQAFVETDQRNAFGLAAERYLIVSPGGLPNDVDLYIAQRALELTQAAVRDGGEILFLAACPGGVGEAHTRAEFYDRLTRPLGEVLAYRTEDYRLFGHKPVKFARMIRRLRRLWVHSEIPDGMLAAAHLDVAADPQAIVDGWLADDPKGRIHVIDGANKVAIYEA